MVREIRNIPKPVNATLKTYPGFLPEEIIPHVESVVSILPL